MLTLLNENNYSGAVKRLTESNNAAPCYYTVCVITENEGVIIEKDREGVHKLY